MKKVKLFRIRIGKGGQLPSGFFEGSIVGLTKVEFDTLQKNKLLAECFDPVQIIEEYEEEQKASLPKEQT